MLRAVDVDAAVAEAVANATEEEKKVGFWARVGAFFKGLFVTRKSKAAAQAAAATTILR